MAKVERYLHSLVSIDGESEVEVADVGTRDDPQGIRLGNEGKLVGGADLEED